MAKRATKAKTTKAKATKAKKAAPKLAPLVLSVRLSPHVALAAAAGGRLAADVDGYPLDLGGLSEAAAKRALTLKDGIRLTALAGQKPADKEIALLVERLARQGLIEYVLARKTDGAELAVIEPQMPDYRPELQKLGSGETVVLSRFAYLRRRGSEMVLESPRAGALFRLSDPGLAALLTMLATPQKVGSLRLARGYPGGELLALLLHADILFRLDRADDDGRRPSEGDDDLVMWDFHDLLFHARSTEGRQANPLGGVYPYVDWIAPPPAVRPSWPGERIDLKDALPASSEAGSTAATLFRERHSVRDYDDQQPITLAELSAFLDGAARILSRWESSLDFDADGMGDAGPVLDYTRRPYPSAGSAYELELYLTVARCDGLSRGFYHYDADAHALVAIPAKPQQLEAMLDHAQYALDAAGHPQVLITVASRFARLAWKYSGIAYALTLKDVGGLLQTFYLMAADMTLGGCAVGTNNIDLFEKVTQIPFHVEGPVGQFTLGRPVASDDTAPAGSG
jgi:SagB-type dehydrogenase family enzyme